MRWRIMSIATINATFQFFNIYRYRLAKGTIIMVKIKNSVDNLD